MSWLGREDRPHDADGTIEQGPHGESEAIRRTADRRVDADTGEILGESLPVRGSTRPDPGGVGRGSERGDAGDTTVQGERTIPSVNRERSIQSRISGGLALATIILLGGGFLFWYYNTQYSKTRDAEDSARRAAGIGRGQRWGRGGTVGGDGRPVHGRLG